MTIMIIVMIIIIKKKKEKLNIFPKENIKIYKILTILLIIFIIITCFITKKDTIYQIFALIYGGIITVIYEELIFRGFVWNRISNGEEDKKQNRKAYIITTILFGIWHLGYVDTVLWRTSLFSPNANIMNIMFWKVITGLIYGIILGFCRYKNKNTYSSILLHSFLNTFGS